MFPLFLVQGLTEGLFASQECRMKLPPLLRLLDFHRRESGDLDQPTRGMHSGGRPTKNIPVCSAGTLAIGSIMIQCDEFKTWPY